MWAKLNIAVVLSDSNSRLNSVARLFGVMLLLPNNKTLWLFFASQI
jgi:hypothetical protein